MRTTGRERLGHPACHCTLVQGGPMSAWLEPTFTGGSGQMTLCSRSSPAYWTSRCQQSFGAARLPAHVSGAWIACASHSPDRRCTGRPDRWLMQPAEVPHLPGKMPGKDTWPENCRDLLNPHPIPGLQEDVTLANSPGPEWPPCAAHAACSSSSQGWSGRR